MSSIENISEGDSVPEAVDPDAGDVNIVSQEVVNIIHGIEEGDFLHVNDGSRTWTVTEVVTTYFDDDDSRECQNGIRLEYSTGVATHDFVTRAIVCDTYPEVSTATLHILSAERPGEEGRSLPVESVERFRASLEWVVVRPGGRAGKWHRPDPAAAARGQAAAACGRGPIEGGSRFVNLSLIDSSYDPCKVCVARLNLADLQISGWPQRPFKS